MSKQVQLSENTNSQLDKIKEARVNGNSLVKSKTSIVAQLIEQAFKKEVK